jgi:hypothetical protein
VIRIISETGPRVCKELAGMKEEQVDLANKLEGKTFRLLGRIAHHQVVRARGWISSAVNDRIGIEPAR